MSTNENVEPFFQYNHREGMYSFASSVIAISILIGVVGVGLLGALLYRNREQERIQASQVNSQHAPKIIMGPSLLPAPPLPQRELLP